MKTHTKLTLLAVIVIAAVLFIFNPTPASFNDFSQNEFIDKRQIKVENPTLISNYLFFSTFTYDLMVNGKKVILTDGEEIVYLGILGQFYQI